MAVNTRHSHLPSGKTPPSDITGRQASPRMRTAIGRWRSAYSLIAISCAALVGMTVLVWRGPCSGGGSEESISNLRTPLQNSASVPARSVSRDTRT